VVEATVRAGDEAEDVVVARAAVKELLGDLRIRQFQRVMMQRRDHSPTLPGGSAFF
jgi:hypothetical protein